MSEMDESKSQGSFQEVDDALEAADEGWTPLGFDPAGFGNRTFLSEPDDDRIRACYFERPEDGALVGRVWYGPGAEGPPGHAHGGSTAAVMDEIMGTSAWLAGHPVVAASVTVNFRRMVPLESIVEVEAYVERVDGNKIHTVGRIVDADGEVYSDGEGLFIEVDPSQFDESVGQLVLEKQGERDE